MSRTGNIWIAIVASAVLAACSSDEGSDGSVDVGGDAQTDTVDTGTDDGGDDAEPDIGTDAAEDATDSDALADALADAQGDAPPIGGPLACDAEPTVADVPAGTASTMELTVTGSSGGPIRAVFTGREIESGTLQVTLSCSDATLGGDEFIPLSPSFSLDAPVARLAGRVELTVPFERARFPDDALPSAIRVFYWPRGADEATQPVVMNLQENMVRGNVRFDTELIGTFQVGVAADAGESYDREWKFRAITGISMGAAGASMIGLRNPEEFDFVAPLGGPTDWTYLSHYIEVGGMGGFLPAPTFGRGPNFTPTEEFEHSQAYDEWFFPTGEGTGGSFNRRDYTQIFHDLMFTFGNIVTYNPDSPYLPPGYPRELATRPASERCPIPEETFTIETGYYDDEFNPDGTYPVIAFCDGQGSRDRSIPFDRACDIDGAPGPDEANEGLYTDPTVQRMPVEIAFAVDVDGDGLRDPGEPVIRNFHEPFEDTGPDGLRSIEEEGYDPVLNPDPAGDDYDYVTNSNGTEGNWLYDEGEPYEDVGLDGLPDTPQFADGGYDFGEGNGRYDYNPNLLRMLQEQDPRTLLQGLSDETLDHLTIYADAGIRDLFNFAVATNQLMGAVHARGQNVRVYDGFYRFEDLTYDQRDEYNFNNVIFEETGRHVYIRYGDPQADEEEICFGDGKHVGTIPQTANRLLTMLAFVINGFPDGERSVLEPPFPLPSGTYLADAPSTGGKTKYSIVFPPGYEWTQCSDGRDNDRDGFRDGEDEDCTAASVTSEAGDPDVTICSDGLDNDEDGLIDDEDPDCAGDPDSEYPADHPLRDAEYPVVFLLHGYGQTPQELQVTAVPFASFMAGGTWAKAIIVFPDGFCGEIERTQCSDNVDNDGDGLIDREDEGCAESGGRSESGERLAYCADGIDNDRDGLIDLEDGGCLSEDWDDEANCVQGNFYANHAAYPGGDGPGPPYEDMFFDLLDHIDDFYPTRDTETFPARR